MSGTQQNRSLIAGVIFLGMAIAVIAWAYLARRAQQHAEVPSTASSSVSQPSDAGDGTAAFNSGSGGATTPSVSDTTKEGESRSRGRDSGEVGKTDDPFDYGKNPPVRGDANPQVASVVEAVKTKSHGERLSVMLSPKPFDLEEYRRSPQSYLNVVEPGRAHMPRQPGPDVPRIQAAGPTRMKMKQGESVVLRAQVTPDMPCTFTSFDLGRFENELTSVTVASSPEGVAEARFLATAGTIEDVHILCASPVMSGQLRFLVTVSK